MGIYLFSKQKTAYEMRISDWSSDVCSSDLAYSRADRSLNHSLIRDHRIFEMGRERDRHILHGDPAHGTTPRSKTLFGDDSGNFTCGAACNTRLIEDYLAPGLANRGSDQLLIVRDERHRVHTFDPRGKA